jgi:hypothetical protein
MVGDESNLANFVEATPPKLQDHLEQVQELTAQ